MRYVSVPRLALLPVSLAALLLLAAFPAQAQSLRPSPAERAAAFDALAAKAARSGPVRVIVNLDVDWVPEGRASSAAKQSQRAEIQSRQSTVLSALAAPQGVTRFRFIPALSLTVDAADLARLRASREVVSVQEDVPVGANEDATPLAPLLSLLGASRLDDSVGLVGAPAAWAAGYDGTGYEVAILDTGVQSSHPFLSGKVVSEACYSTTFSGNPSYSVCPGGVASSTAAGSAVNCSSASWSTDCDHGTHVAGIAAGNQPAAATGPTSGVARGANIVAIQVFSGFTGAPNCGTGNMTCALSYNTDQILGLERVYDLVVNGGRPIVSANMSIGGGRSLSTCDANTAKAAIDNLLSVGVSTVISAGNDGYQNSTSAPACISTAVSVGSTTKTDEVSGFSNIAPWVDLFAPGSDIQSSIPTNSYAFYNGTSMAAPHVAGAFAILRQRFPTETPAQLLARLRYSGAGITAGSPSARYPRIQIDAAFLRPAVFSFAPGSISVGLPVGGTTTKTLAISNTATAGSGPITWTASVQNLMPRPSNGGTPAPATAGALEAGALEAGALEAGARALSEPMTAGAVETEGALVQVSPATIRSVENEPADRGQASIRCTNGQTIEQPSNTTSFNVTTTNEYGQSFVAPCTGPMTSVAPRFSGTGTGAFSTVLRLYNGSGVLGTVLAAVPNTTTAPASGLYEISYVFAAPVEVVKGQTYTWFVDVVSGAASMSLNQNDVYTGGSRWRSTTGAVANAVATTGDMRYRATFGGPDAWLSLSATGGTVAAGTSGNLVVTLNATGLTEGIYTAEIVLTSNDANTPVATVPVTLTVTGASVIAGGAGWRLLAAPATGVTVSDLAAMNLVQGVPGYYPGVGANLLTGYTGSGYTPIAGGSTVLAPGRGFWWYFYNQNLTPGGASNSVALPTTLATTNPSVTADTPVALHAAGTTYNLLGNPFGTSLSIAGVASWPGASNLASTVAQVWDASTSSYDLSLVLPTVAPWQGFWVEGATAGTLTIPASARTTGGVLQRADPVPMVAFDLAQADGPLHDRAAVLTFPDGATDGRDAFDAAKLTPAAGAYIVAALGDAGALQAAESRPAPATAAVSVPLHVASVGAGERLVLTWPVLEALPETWAVTLTDTQTNTTVDLRTATEYAFTVAAAPAGDALAMPEAVAMRPSAFAASPARFVVTVGPRGATAGEGGTAAVFALSAPAPNPSRGRATLAYSLAEAGSARLTVVDLLGRDVAVVVDGDQAAGRHVETVDTGALAPGVYVVRLASGAQQATQRLVVVR